MNIYNRFIRTASRLLRFGHTQAFLSHSPKAILIAILLNPGFSYSEVIFSDNFDATPDWQNVGSQRCNWIGWDEDADDTSCANLPLNYDLMYFSDSNYSEPMCEINSKGARGTGKGLRVNDESNGDSNSWGSDCQIAKYFPQQQPEFWASYYIHYNPNMAWHSATAMSKIFRVGHYNPKVVDGTAQTSTFNTNNNSDKNGGHGPTTSGLFFLDTKQVGSPELMRLQQAVRCAPTYKCGSYDEAWFQNFSGTPGDSWAETLGDNKWHHVEVRLKMNSSPGAANGILEVYFDGALQTKRTNIPWRMSGVDPSVVYGFNMFTIGGNSNNIWAGQTDAQQWMYDVDDLRICTTRCDAPEVASPPSAPSSVVVVQ